MGVTYTKIVENKHKNTYELVFGFEHGDADFNNSYSGFFSEMNESQLVNYIKKAREIYDLVELRRTSNFKLPDDFEETATIDGFAIPLESDIYAKNYTSAYYASSGISEIFYYNDNGDKFKVTIDI